MTNELIETICSDEYRGGDLIVSVPVTLLMQNIVDSCDFGPMDSDEAWFEMIRTKAGDSGFGHLLDSILSHGMSPHSPIGIIWDDWSPNQGLRIVEGHHRLTAAILMCMDEVYVSAYGRGHSPTGEHISAHYSTDFNPVEVDI